ncbi:mechanosensitive ion channel [Microbacterium trichothecenolyticum]|uniref:mechanosensitive ion channel family protein n=1 Tax=Microbacterium trichothecenolyticum TaxID=69370 RepID=UPI001C6EF555|nr:mechanosensitive ion channel domain-containing protein [Microbacterium trichothecenolyticum]MBW9119343.1 mechanosensitive ion channel [Microbacterium trichothecenolyticum]
MDFSQFLSTPITWWQVLWAIVALLAGWIASRIAKRTVTDLMRHVPTATPAATRFAARFAQYTLLLVGFGLALAFLGANVQPVLAVVIVLVVVAALVLRGVADNFAASVLIATRKPVMVGEEITVEGPDGKPLTGTVIELNSRAVVFTTPDGRTAHVPNSKLLAETLVNNSRHGGRRSEVQVRVERSGTAVDEVVGALVESAAAVEGVHADPAAGVLVTAVSATRITGRVLFWHDAAQGLAVTSDVVAALTAGLAQHGWSSTVTSETVAPPLVPGDPV